MRRDMAFMLAFLALLLNFAISYPVRMSHSTDMIENEYDQKSLYDTLSRYEKNLISKRIDSLVKKGFKALYDDNYEIIISRRDSLLAPTRNENIPSIAKRNSFSHKHSSAISSILSKIKNNG